VFLARGHCNVWASRGRSYRANAGIEHAEVMATIKPRHGWCAAAFTPDVKSYGVSNAMMIRCAGIGSYGAIARLGVQVC